MRMVCMLTLIAALFGCETAYYSINEQVGRLKNDILIDRVEDAVAAQEQAKEEFKDALEQFEAVVGVSESELKSTYQRLDSALSRAQRRARAVKDRIESVQDVSADLFEEWADELTQIRNPQLRSNSARQLRASRERAASLIQSMNRAALRMAPVLNAFQDHVLYLKHNLNARAIASLEGELSGINADVARLVSEMEASIAEAEAFVRRMNGDESPVSVNG